MAYTFSYQTSPVVPMGPMEEPGHRARAPLLRGKDSNLRPLGYEPNELPLLHPAI